MIPEIGLMIGAYIITRMAEIFATSSQRTIEKGFVKVCAGGTLLFALYTMLSLFVRGSSISTRGF